MILNIEFFRNSMKALCENCTIAQEVTNHLFQEHGHNFGQDLIARNLQRSRDHALGSYAEFREFCGLSPLSQSWNKKPKEISQETWDKFKTVYGNPMEIELFTGGVSEKPEMLSVVGPTFACLISYQFFLLKHGDRFFFTHQCKKFPRKNRRKMSKYDRKFYYQIKSGLMDRDMITRLMTQRETKNCDAFRVFTPRERNEIRKRTLGDIICENTKSIAGTTQFVNLAESGSNLYLPCDQRSPLDLSVFTKY